MILPYHYNSTALTLPYNPINRNTPHEMKTINPCNLLSVMAIVFLTISAIPAKADVKIFDGKNPVTYNLPGWLRQPVPQVAAGMFDSDMECITGRKPLNKDRAGSTVRIYNLAVASPGELEELRKAKVDVSRVKERKDAFCLKAHKGKLYAVGADDRGTAYAILEISRLAGVSPWIWWNDATPLKKSVISLPDNFASYQSPSVEYRGIFLNDEDWTLQPWSWMTFEKGQKTGTIGAKTYKEIFKLLLRLRANAIWPGMHGITTPFYFTEGAKETADSCGIAVGTSHCEPLMRNNVGEWKEKERGAYNYITNRQAVKGYWTERLREAGKFENMYTIGMRGIHDGHMEGVNTMEEKVSALQQVINDQRDLLARYVNPDVESIPQVFVPYKEVLDIMDHGLVVPEDVTLMWCDDNYGYMTRLSDKAQQKRKGGAGVYYHLSYWGRPHDYMWLGATQPGLVYSEMKAAYDHNARKVWIVNVHDMKTASYPLELFLDMAWDITAVDAPGVQAHLSSWLCREFGEEAGLALTPVMTEYYRLGGIRRPEHMGWTQVELSDRKAYPRGRSHVIDTELSFTEFGSEADRYLETYRDIARQVKEIERYVPSERRDNYFAQIKYPVLSASLMARKMLEAQRARSYASGQCDASLWTRDSLMLGACARSIDAYNEIRRLTAIYNDSLAGGKWRHSMCMNPRDLCVFNPPVLPLWLSSDEMDEYRGSESPRPRIADTSGCAARNACEYSSASFSPEPISMLGHSMNAVPIPKGESLTFDFNRDKDGEAYLLTALIPTQPNDNGDIRIAISVDGQAPQTISFKEAGRTDTWKENVLRNQARIHTDHRLSPGNHTVKITALDDHVILDQVMLDSKKNRNFYIIPTNI